MEKTSLNIERIQNTLEFIESYKNAKARHQKMIAELKQNIQDNIEAICRLTLNDKQDDEWLEYNEKMLAKYKWKLAEEREGKNYGYGRLL